MLKVYRVDISRLTAEERQETDDKLRSLSHIVSARDPLGETALIAFEDEPGSFPAPDDYKASLGLPEQCTVTDITGQDLLR